MLMLVSFWSTMRTGAYFAVWRENSTLRFSLHIFKFFVPFFRGGVFLDMCPRG